MQSLDTDVQSLGGGGGYGLGLGGNSGYNPLLWLITLGFLRGGNGFFGNEGQGAATAAVANTTGIAENSAKIDCLSQGQTFLQNSLNQNNLDNRITALNDNFVTLTGINRDIQDTIFRENAAMQRQISECCCELSKGQSEIQTAIALQTNTIVMNDNNNTQKILDTLCQSQIENLRTDNANLRSSLNSQTIISEITNRCSYNCGPFANAQVGPRGQQLA